MPKGCKEAVMNATREEVYATIIGMREDAKNNAFSKDMNFQVALFRLNILDKLWFLTRKDKREMGAIIEYMTDVVNK